MATNGSTISNNAIGISTTGSNPNNGNLAWVYDVPGENILGIYTENPKNIAIQAGGGQLFLNGEVNFAYGITFDSNLGNTIQNINGRLNITAAGGVSLDGNLGFFGGAPVPQASGIDYSGEFASGAVQDAEARSIIGQIVVLLNYYGLCPET